MIEEAADRVLEYDERFIGPSTKDALPPAVAIYWSTAKWLSNLRVRWTTNAADR
jgi:hypothetical protein